MEFEINDILIAACLLCGQRRLKRECSSISLEIMRLAASCAEQPNYVARASASSENCSFLFYRTSEIAFHPISINQREPSESATNSQYKIRKRIRSTRRWIRFLAHIIYEIIYSIILF
jgi:hypothetical protein